MARTIAKDYDEKRIMILRNAARVFAREGCSRASMNMIAQECGFSKANIYHYYDSKDAIIFDILDTYLSALKARLYGLPLEGLSAADQLHQLLSETLRAYQGMDDEHKIQTEGIPLLPLPQQEILRSYQRDIVGLMSAVLKDIAPETFCNAPDTLRSATMSIFGMLNWFYMWNREAGSAAREDYANLVQKLTLGGVKSL